MMNVFLSLQSVRFSVEPKGIGSILSEDVEAKQRRSSQSLRRTLSADMSSQGWIARKNPLRKTCSSYKLFSNSDSDSAEYSDSDAEDRNHGEEEEEEEEEEHDVFSMTDAEHEDEDEEQEEAAEEDEQDPEDLHPWSLRRSRTRPQRCEASFASLFVKEVKSDSSQWEPCKPYVHPKKKNTLSDQSLRMCTEALGCESGTDCSYGSLSDLDDNCSSSEDSVSVLEDEEEEKEEENRQIPSEDDGITENYKFSDNVNGSVQDEEIICGKKSLRSVKSFPPPLSSISRSNGPCISMRSHKQDGRLLLQAVKVESQKHLHAHRVDGRLQLRFIGTPLPLSAEQSSQGEKVSKSQPAKEEEFRAQNSAPEQKSQQQLESYMFSKVSNLRRHTLKSDIQNLNLNKELFLNSSLTSNVVKKASLFNEHQEIRGSSNIVSKDSNDFHLKFRRAEPNSRLLCNSNDFCKPPFSANTGTGWKDSPKSRPSQSLITSPTLLNYPLNGIRYFGGDLKESAHSLPKSPLKDVFRRCKDRKWSLNCEPYCIATS